jgi:hypothetical protein
MVGSDKFGNGLTTSGVGQPERPGAAKAGHASPAPGKTSSAQASRPASPLKQLSQAGNRFVRLTDGQTAKPASGSPSNPAPKRPAETAATAKPQAPRADTPSGTPAAGSAGPTKTVKLEELLGNESGDPQQAAKEWSVAPSQVDYEDSLLTCLSLVAGLLERPISREALKSGLPHASEQFTPELAIRAADRAGLTAKVMRRPKLDQILAVSLPCNSSNNLHPVR